MLHRFFHLATTHTAYFVKWTIVFCLSYHGDLSPALGNWPPRTVGETRADKIILESQMIKPEKET